MDYSHKTVSDWLVYLDRENKNSRVMQIAHNVLDRHAKMDKQLQKFYKTEYKLVSWVNKLSNEQLMKMGFKMF